MKLHEEFKLYENMWETLQEAPTGGADVSTYVVIEVGMMLYRCLIQTDNETDAKVAYNNAITNMLKQRHIRAIWLLKFSNLTQEQLDNLEWPGHLREIIEKIPYEVVDEIDKDTALKTTSKKTKVKTKYYYVVCLNEETFKAPEVLAAGTIKVDLTTLTRSETPEERAMTDYFDSTEIAYSDDWDDTMWDSLTRYVYEIDANTYKTKAGLPKTDSEIIKYVEESLADYED